MNRWWLSPPSIARFCSVLVLLYFVPLLTRTLLEMLTPSFPMFTMPMSPIICHRNSGNHQLCNSPLLRYTLLGSEHLSRWILPFWLWYHRELIWMISSVSSTSDSFSFVCVFAVEGGYRYESSKAVLLMLRYFQHRFLFRWQSADFPSSSPAQSVLLNVGVNAETHRPIWSSLRWFRITVDDSGGQGITRHLTSLVRD